LCWKTWKNYPMKMGLTPCEKQELQLNITGKDACEVSVRRNDWVRRKNEISISYVNMFRSAKSQVTILCAYFLPGRLIRHQIRYAVRRGVKIIVITAGVSDVKVAKYAERF